MGLGKGNAAKTSEIHALKVSQSLYGIVIPIIWGTQRVQQNLIWNGDLSASQQNVGGKGLGKNGGTQYDYRAATQGALCHGQIYGLGNVWAQNGRLTLQNVSADYTVPVGGGTVVVPHADRFHIDRGVGIAQPYSVTANDYGSPGSTTYTGVQMKPMQQVVGTPGTNQYAQTGGAYTFAAGNAGSTVTISYTFSLYTLGASEDYNIPLTSPFEIAPQYQAYFYADEGVSFVDTGIPLARVSGSPVSGEYSIDNGNYFFAAADAGRPVVIKYQWQQSDSSIDPASTLQFTLIEGTIGQAPWDYMTSKHLSQALGYSGIALICAPSIDLGPEAMLPNYNFEVLAPLRYGAGIEDADLALVIEDFLLNPYYGCRYGGAVDDSLLGIARSYWNANNFFVSPVLDTQRAASQTIDDWCEAGNVGNFWSEGKPKFIPYGDTTTVGNGFVFTPQTHPVVDLTDDDFIAEGGEDPVQIDRTEWEDAYNEVKVQYTNRANSYNSNSIIEHDDWAISQYGLRPEGQKDYSFICTQEAAQFAANVRLKRLVNIRKKYTFKISGIRYCFLELMDMVTLTDLTLGLSKEPVRIKEIREDENRVLTITAEEFPWGTATATLYSKQNVVPPSPSPGQADPMNTNVADIFELPSRVAATLANSPYQIGIALSGGPNWGGCQVWMSKDGVNYEYLGDQKGPTRAGVITADLPAGSDPDLTNTLSVKTTGELFNVTQPAADSFATLSKVGTEFIAYENATLTASSGLENSYDLTYLRRGVFSTPNMDHAANDPAQNTFVRCDGQLFLVSYDPSLAGSTVYFKFPAFNGLGGRQQDLASVAAYPFTLQGLNTATGMTVDSVFDSGGATASIRVYRAGGAVTDDGSAALTNGAVITLPAYSQSGFALNTVYYVNYDPISESYLFYTDQNAWLIDEVVNGYIKIGSTMSATDWTFIPLEGGGTLAMKAGIINNLSSPALPPGYDYARALTFATPGRAYDSGDVIFHGVAYANFQSGTSPTSAISNGGGGSAGQTTNYAIVAWTSGATVDVSSSGGWTTLKATTANGDPLAIVAGAVANGGYVPTPSGYDQSTMLPMAGLCGYVETGAQAHGVGHASVASDGQVTADYYDENFHVSAQGSVNVLAFFTVTGAGISKTTLGSTAYLSVPLPGGKSVGIAEGFVPTGGSVTIVPGTSLRSSCGAMASMDGGQASHRCHGFTSATTSGSLTWSGTYADGEGNTWTGYGNVLAFSTN